MYVARLWFYLSWINLEVFFKSSDATRCDVKPNKYTLAKLDYNTTMEWKFETGKDETFYQLLVKVNDSYLAMKTSPSKELQKMNNKMNIYFQIYEKSDFVFVVTLINVKKRFSGRYCLDFIYRENSENVLGTKTCCTELLVYDTPRILYHTSDQNVTQRSNVSLRCNASGDPRPTLNWKKEIGDMSSLNFATYNLTIRGKESEGRYCCHATNEYGIAVKCIYVIVTEYQPMHTVLSAPEKYAIKDRTLEVVCFANAFPPARYSFTIGNNKLGEIKGGIIHINNTMTYDKTFVNISCVPNNRYGEGKSAHLHLPIYELPTIKEHSKTETVMTSSNITLKCEATGVPKPVINWFNEKHNPLNQTHADKENGHYELYNNECGQRTILFFCMALNMVGNVSKEIKVQAFRNCSNEESTDGLDDEGPLSTSGVSLQIIIVAIVCALVIVTIVLILVFGLIARRRNKSKRAVNKGTQKQEHRQNQLVDESPYGEPFDAIPMKGQTFSSSSNIDYATVEETGYKPNTTNHLPVDEASSSREVGHNVEPVYAKVKKKKKWKDKSADITLSPLYAEIPANILNPENPSTSTTTQQEPSTSNNKNKNSEAEDAVDSGEGSWFSWVY